MVNGVSSSNGFDLKDTYKQKKFKLRQKNASERKLLAKKFFEKKFLTNDYKQKPNGKATDQTFLIAIKK
jgi:hypothetical protein